MSPRSNKAFPMQLCRLPSNSHLLGTSFSDHFCTTFRTSLAFLRLSSAFPEIRTETKRKSDHLPCKKKSRKWHDVHFDTHLTQIYMLNALKHKLRRFRQRARFSFCVEALPFLGRQQFLLIQELSATMDQCEAVLNDVQLYILCKSLDNSFKSESISNYV